MKIVKFENENTLFFVSGMFAGGWIWQDTYPNIPSAAHSFIMNEPLCTLGSSVDELSGKIIEELGNIKRPVTLVGNSLGSFVCMNIAAKAPELVSRVIISGSAGFGEVVLPVKLSRHNAGELAQELVEMITFDKKTITPFAIQKTSESFRHNLKNIARLMRESNMLKAAQILPDVHCPIHAIWGRDDVITPLSETLEAFNKFNIQLSIINQCGHSPMYEKPREFAQLVNSYLQFSTHH